jgi:hypothetical protein
MSNDLRAQLPIAEALKFVPHHLCDPPYWFIRELDKNVLQQLAINEVEMHRAILEAQIKASERSLEILKQMG